MAIYPTRVWCTRDVDGSLVVVQDGELGIRYKVIADPFADATEELVTR